MDSDFRPINRSSRPAPGSKANTPAFLTPEEVAAMDDVNSSATIPEQIEPTKTGVSTAPGRNHNGQSGWREKLKLHWPPGRKELVAAAGLLIIIGLAVFLLWPQPPKKATVVHQPQKAAKPAAPKTVTSKLSGLQVDPSVNNGPVTGVMIENSTDARPQSGLSQASVVFEAIAEGGITRFLALYLDNKPDNIGPIRSARPYYVQWNLGFDAGYAHVGGSPEALADIKAWGVRDLDQFFNGGSYHRVSSRAAPHNVYTSLSTLNQLEAAKGYTNSVFTSLGRKLKETPSKQPAAKSINLAISGSLYNVHYDYDAATNSYKRSEGGAPHIDANNNAQISPKVVVALVMPYGLEADDHHSFYNTIGNGPVYVFQDGGVTTGQWSKTGAKDQFTFTDSSGQPILLNPGQTWFTALGNASSLTYSP